MPLCKCVCLCIYVSACAVVCMCVCGYVYAWVFYLYVRVPLCVCACAVRVQGAPHVSTRTSCSSIDLILRSAFSIQISPVNGCVIEHVAENSLPDTRKPGTAIWHAGPKAGVSRTRARRRLAQTRGRTAPRLEFSSDSGVIWNGTSAALITSLLGCGTSPRTYGRDGECAARPPAQAKGLAAPHLVLDEELDALAEALVEHGPRHVDLDAVLNVHKDALVRFVQRQAVARA
jgi:hypothetical protein